WKVLQAGEIRNPISIKSKEALIFEFNAGELTFFGDLGCNTIRGKIKSIDPKNIEFGPGASTKMACIDMSVENEILKAISETKTYQIAENQLTLLDQNGALLMLFQAVD
uniref:META domain-containing protein n=1 Tax=Algoriphagus sp. TaxID=1872435 RepID=UPI0025EBD706